MTHIFLTRELLFNLWSPPQIHTSGPNRGPDRGPLPPRSGKGKSDAIKAKLYGRYGKRIQQVAKQGGADPSVNIALSDLIDEAKTAGGDQ